MTTPAKALADRLDEQKFGPAMKWGGETAVHSHVGVVQLTANERDLIVTTLRSLPDAPRGREEIARIIEPTAYHLRDELAKAESAGFPKRNVAEELADKQINIALTKADAILAPPPATPRPVEIEEVTGREGVREARAALERAQDVLRRYMRHEHDGTVRSSANAVLHEIKYALELPAQDTADRTGAVPVAWRTKNDHGDWYTTADFALAETWRKIEQREVEPLYSTPARTTEARTERREDWQPIETAPDDGKFYLYGLHVAKFGITWFEVHYLARDEDGEMRETSTDIFGSWTFGDFECWAIVPQPALSLHDGEKG